jgi:hypothetical protein
MAESIMGWQLGVGDQCVVLTVTFGRLNKPRTLPINSIAMYQILANGGATS